MSRTRGQIIGGYVRKTVSLPASLAADIEAHLKGSPGVTMSWFVTDACQCMLNLCKKPAKKKG